MKNQLPTPLPALHLAPPVCYAPAAAQVPASEPATMLGFAAVITGPASHQPIRPAMPRP